MWWFIKLCRQTYQKWFSLSFWNASLTKSAGSPLPCHRVRIPSHWRLPSYICDTGIWFHVGQLLQHLGVYVWLELLLLTVVQNSAFLTFWLRFPHGGEHQFLIPFWNLWEWGQQGRADVLGSQESCFKAAGRSAFVRCPASSSSYTRCLGNLPLGHHQCARPPLAPNLASLQWKQFHLAWSWNLRHKQDWAERFSQSFASMDVWLKKLDRDSTFPSNPSTLWWHDHNWFFVWWFFFTKSNCMHTDLEVHRDLSGQQQTPPWQTTWGTGFLPTVPVSRNQPQLPATWLGSRLFLDCLSSYLAKNVYGVP